MHTIELGGTGIRTARFAFGGIVVKGEDAGTASRWVAEAVDAGIGYFDVAPSYGDAQDRLGPALAPYRSKVALACKTVERGGAAARAELEASLKVLRSDFFDVYQLHAMNTQEDIDAALAPGGALEAVRNAREKGLTRFIGFSSHNEETALKLLALFDFDTVMFPVNWAMLIHRGFGARLVEKAAALNMGRIAIKAQAYGGKEDRSEDCGKAWYRPILEPELAALALRYTLSQPVHIALSSGEPSAYRLGLEHLRACDGVFEPPTSEELADLRAAAEKARPLFMG